MFLGVSSTGFQVHYSTRLTFSAVSAGEQRGNARLALGSSRRITELARLRLGWILSSGLRSFSGITAGRGESQHLTSPKS